MDKATVFLGSSFFFFFSLLFVRFFLRDYLIQVVVKMYFT